MKTLRKRAEEITNQYDFLQLEDTSPNTLALNVMLGNTYEGRIVGSANISGDIIEFAVTSPSTREAVSIRTKRNSDNLFVTTMKAPGNKNPYGIEEGMFVNKSYIDYLVTQLVNYLNKRIAE